ncbi:cation:proton antiporter [Kitasatospora sp. NPDC057512]|uniref:cation:proton antiporter n=1 Tax=Kitasatospora sp. NPDC057512 TaxID=3346154 RepID=UPI0036968347
MDVLQLLTRVVHAAAVLGVVLLIAVAGRRVARRLRQPEVIGEITGGLLAGPAVIALAGRPAFDAVLPGPVFDLVKTVAEAALVLFLVGLAHKLRRGRDRLPRRATTWITVGALVPPLATGGLLVGLIALTGDRAARGGAPLPAFLLMVAVTMSITAVPVMARILADRGMSDGVPGRLSLASAVVIDACGWLLLSLAISLGAGDPARSLHSLRALAVGVVCALAIRYALGTRTASRLCARSPRAMAVLIAVAALAVAFAMKHLGMTSILGAALAGLAVPHDDGGPWTRVVSTVSRSGQFLTPAFFVVTGVTVLTGAFSATSGVLIAGTVLLGFLGKGLGGYLGARIGGQPPRTARRIGALMNTRGLTELIVLQAGFASGVLPAPLVLALVVMALVTTAATGPLLELFDRMEGRRAAEGISATAMAPVKSVETESGAR